MFDGFDGSPDLPHHHHSSSASPHLAHPLEQAERSGIFLLLSNPQVWLTHSYTTKSSSIFLPSKVQKFPLQVLQLVRGRDGSPILMPTRPALLPARKIGAKGCRPLSFTLITLWQMKVLRPALPLSCSQHQLTSIQLTETSLLCCPSEVQSLFPHFHYLRAGSPTCHRW